MAEIDEKYDFTTENIDKSPNQHGVYILNDGGEIIYIGRAAGEGVTIRSRLRDHKAGRDGLCTKLATQYSRERNSRPVAREKELLDNYLNRYGKLPRCNDRMA